MEDCIGGSVRRSN
ncbi:unnamed protein product, partial [Onchocerca ochengi]|uniref:Uncharacterized protein n=1 Tax=Onchocerca ochengi TaxID=42157 RepID=A0A182F0G1_ONCOC